MSYFDVPEHWEAWLLELQELKALRERNKKQNDAQNDSPPNQGTEYHGPNDTGKLETVESKKKNIPDDWKLRSKGIYDQSDHIPHDDEYYFNVKKRARIEDVLYDDGLDLVGGFSSVLDIPIDQDMLQDDDLAEPINEDWNLSYDEQDSNFDLEKAANTLTIQDIQNMGTLADPELLLEESDLDEDYEEDFIGEIDVNSILSDDD